MENQEQDDVVLPDVEGRYRLDVGAADNGTWVVDQTEVETRETKRVAIFPADERVVRVLDEETGKHKFATRDMAQIRAMVFADIFSQLASAGQIDF